MSQTRACPSFRARGRPHRQPLALARHPLSRWKVPHVSATVALMKCKADDMNEGASPNHCRGSDIPLRRDFKNNRCRGRRRPESRTGFDLCCSAPDNLQIILVWLGWEVVDQSEPVWGRFDGGCMPPHSGTFWGAARGSFSCGSTRGVGQMGRKSEGRLPKFGRDRPHGASP